MENQLRRALSLFCPDSYCDGRVRSTWGQKATRPYGYYTLLAISSTCFGRGFDQLVRRIDELTGSFPIESLYSLTDLFLIGETYQPQTWTVSLCVSSPLPRTPPPPHPSIPCIAFIERRKEVGQMGWSSGYRWTPWFTSPSLFFFLFFTVYLL